MKPPNAISSCIQRNQKRKALATAQRRKDYAKGRSVGLFLANLGEFASLRETFCFFFNKFTILGLIAFFCALNSGFAADRPNFSGAWVLDKDKSFSNPPGFDQTMTVTHNGDQIKVEGKQTTARGEVAINESYTIDGKQAEFTPPNPPNAKGKRKASWLPNNRGFIIEDEIISDSQNGPVTQNITRKWLLSPDGSTLTIDYYFDGPRGSFESKRVFVRKKE